MIVGIAADHAGFWLKKPILQKLEEWGFVVSDFGADRRIDDDDYPDYVVPMVEAVAAKRIERGIAVCGSGVGACIAANKVKGIRAGLIADTYSAHQGVEDDDMNVICLGARVIGEDLAFELIHAFLFAAFKNEPRFLRRLEKIHSIGK